MTVLKAILAINLVVFTVTWVFHLLRFSRAAKFGYFVGGLAQLFFLITVVYQRNPLWSDRLIWLTLITYALAFNIQFVLRGGFNNRSYWFIYWLNIILIGLSLLFAPVTLNEWPSGVSFVKFVFQFLLGSIAFSFVSWQCFLLVSDKTRFFRTEKIDSFIAMFFWMAKIISSAFWSKYAWGRYWSSGVEENHMIAVLVLLMLNWVLSFRYTNERVTKFNAFIYLSLLVAFVFPLYVLIRHHSGYGS